MNVQKFVILGAKSNPSNAHSSICHCIGLSVGQLVSDSKNEPCWHNKAILVLLLPLLNSTQLDLTPCIRHDFEISQFIPNKQISYGTTEKYLFVASPKRLKVHYNEEISMFVHPSPMGSQGKPASREDKEKSKRASSHASE